MESSRRSFLATSAAALATLGTPSLGAQQPARRGIHVPASRDRFGKSLPLGGNNRMECKVATEDSQGGLYVFEHTHTVRGGPAQHIHLEQDEWIYVLKGLFVFEVGTERFRLTPGDSLWMPRMVPHVWACISDEPGTFLAAVQPALRFERFMAELAAFKAPPTREQAEELFPRYGMSVTGPPLSV